MAGIYRPRNARGSPLWRIVAGFGPAFLALYEERFASRFGRLRAVVRRAAAKFIRCGLPEFGFARVRCPACRDEYLLAFSCRARGVCPSCDAKRSATWAAWVVDELVRPVPHRHLVFTVPRMLRVYFRNDRSLLTRLARWAYDCLRAVMAEVVPGRDARPGALAVIQTAGSLADWNPHVHMIVTAGTFAADGRFCLLPLGFVRPLAEHFRCRVLAEMHELGLISAERHDLLRSWRHSGFSVYPGRRVRANDRQALEELARYVHRCPIALDRLTYSEESGTVLYRSGEHIHPRYRANFRVFAPLDFLAEALLHVPDPWRHESIAYGVYANAARGKDARDGLRTGEEPGEGAPIDERLLRSRWRELLRRVFEIDPLRCTRCGSLMVPLSVVTDPVVIEKILRHLGLWQGRAPPVPAVHGAPEADAPASDREIEHDPECNRPAEHDDTNQVPPDWDDWY